MGERTILKMIFCFGMNFLWTKHFLLLVLLISVWTGRNCHKLNTFKKFLKKGRNRLLYCWCTSNIWWTTDNLAINPTMDRGAPRPSLSIRSWRKLSLRIRHYILWRALPLSWWAWSWLVISTFMKISTNLFSRALCPCIHNTKEFWRKKPTRNPPPMTLSSSKSTKIKDLRNNG